MDPIPLGSEACCGNTKLPVIPNLPAVLVTAVLFIIATNGISTEENLIVDKGKSVRV